MSSSLELCIFRHGRTTWNALGKYQGHADVDLDDFGRRQALAVAPRVKEIDPVAIYSSDLKRCLNTASAIESDLEIRHDQRLRERDVGEWSGKTRAEISKAFPADFALWIDGLEVRPGGGETSGEMLVRVASFFDSMTERHKFGAVVAFSHGGWIKVAAQWVLTGRVERIGLGVVSQASLTTFAHVDGAWRVEAYNDRGHLLDLEDVDHADPSPQPAVY